MPRPGIEPGSSAHKINILPTEQSQPTSYFTHFCLFSVNGVFEPEDVYILGVTDPDGDAITIILESDYFQLVNDDNVRLIKQLDYEVTVGF